MIRVTHITECGSLMYAQIASDGKINYITTRNTALKMLLVDLYLDVDETQSKLYTLVKNIEPLLGDDDALNSLAQLYVHHYGECDPLFYTI